MLHLSQGQLNLLETCPRKFQHIYCEQLGAVVTPDQQDRFTWGTRFHLLMQQRELGLPIALSQPSDLLQRSVKQFLQAAPDLFPATSTALRQSEHRRMLQFQDCLFTVIYDLVILEKDKAQILDWKTYPRPRNAVWLAQNWQTRLYPFVLAKTSDYAPEQISMTYWFIQAIDQDDQDTDQDIDPKPLTFTYSTQQHQQIEQDLTHLLHRLTGWLQTYDTGQPLPQIESTENCHQCTFARRCQRSNSEALGATGLAEIDEIAI